MNAAPLSRPGRGRLLLCVIGAHLLAAWWLNSALRPRLRGEAPAAARPLWLQLLPAPERPMPEQPAPPAGPRARAPAAPRPQAAAPVVAPIAITAPMAIAPPAAITPPVTAATEPQAIGAAPAASAVAAAPPLASAPLDLRLPKGAASQPRSLASLLRDDPRLRDRPLTASERIGQALDATIHEEALPDGSRRFRRGNECLVARPSRAGQIDPFDSTHPKPWLVGPC